MKNVTAIQQAINEGRTDLSIVREFGVSYGTLAKIRSGEVQQEATPAPRPAKRSRKRTAKRAASAVTAKAAAPRRTQRHQVNVTDLISKGWNNGKISKATGLTTQQIAGYRAAAARRAKSSNA